MSSQLFDSLGASTAVMLDAESAHVLAPLNEFDALSLVESAAEDPACWNDVALLWQRYRIHAENTEFADGLPIRVVELKQAIAALAGAESWFAVDLVQKRLLTGGRFPRMRLRGEPRDQQGTSCHTTLLPPWWELSQRVAPALLCAKRQTPLHIPSPRRDVLWGLPMTRFFARRMLSLVRDGREWVGKDWQGHPCGNVDLTVEVHRDWLMTPCPELQGAIPRDCLHGGMEWIDDLAQAQAFRLYDGQPLVPVPSALSTYETAAMGRHEVVLYFDACRDTLDAGWRWLLEEQCRVGAPRAEYALAESMSQFLAMWLSSPFEGGRPPERIIQCDRARVPLVAEPGSHVIDCDCPICEMMASDMLGPAIEHFDAHALDVDGEFAFSIHATRQEWEAEQLEWEELNACIEEECLSHDGADDEGDDALRSAWGGVVNDEAEYNWNAFGHLRMAFLVADLVGSLQSNGSDHGDIVELNSAFRQYRSSEVAAEVQAYAINFKQTLEQLAAKHPDLVSRAADLQSRIDEQLRGSTIDGPGSAAF